MASTQVIRAGVGRANIVIKTNGGMVTLEKQVGNDWVVVDTFNTDGAWPVDLGQSKTRVTPSGGAEYELGA